MPETKPKRPRCYNCVYASEGFKVGKTTHHHCHGPEYEAMDKKGELISPWETLREWWDKCSDHKFKEPATEAVAQ